MTTEINDSAFRAYEDYVLNDRNIGTGLKGLIPGAESHNYLKCIDLLTKKKLNLSNEERSFIESYTSKKNTDEAKKIDIRMLLLKYDAAKSDKEKTAILEEISTKYLKPSFKHERPGSLNVKTAHKEETVKSAEKNLLDEIDLDKELEALYKGGKRINEFDLTVLAKLNLTKLKKQDFYALIDLMAGNTIMMDSNPGFYSTYARWLREDFARNNYSGVQPRMFNNMSLEQMDKLATELHELKEAQNFITIYFKKKFSKELSSEDNTNLNHKEKRANLIKMYEYARGLPPVLFGLKSSLLLEILENGIKINEYDENYFLEYLRCPARRTFMVMPHTKNCSQWNYILNPIQVEHNKNYSDYKRDVDSNLFTKYLQHFFLNGKEMKLFNPYLEQEFLVSVWEDAILMTGKEVAFNEINSSRLERLGTEVKINIVEYNKEVFALNDDISLWVEIKNVPALFVKVFEINAENYYREEKQSFRADVNLDGLVASLERTIDYKKSPQIKFTEELKFPELKGKMGLYVIELIGNGKSSRAILRIGTISLITRQTTAGQISYILDAERKICCDESTGIWMDNQYFKADVSQHGRIIVPYLPSNGPKVTKAVLLHKGLAQFVDMQRLEEVYSLSCGFYLLPESVIMGESTTIMIRPQLLINGRMTDTKLLKNMKCVLLTHNYVEDIPVTKTYDKLKFSDKEEVLVKFQVGANLKQIKIEFFAEVMNMTKDRTEKLSASHNFPILTHTSGNSIADLYLRLNQNREYELHMLGKNGEPISNNRVEFLFKTRLFNYQLSMAETTNGQGVIKIGKLKDVTSVDVTVYQSQSREQILRTWTIPSATMIQYPTSIDVIENEVIELPISTEHLEKRLYLLSVDKNVVLYNFSHLIKIKSNKEDLYGIVDIAGLKTGNYILKGVGNNEISIKVHDGTYWEEDPSYILKQYSLLENSTRQGFIKIRKVKFEEAKEGGGIMKAQIESSTQDQWRAHVMFFRYLPGDLNALTLRLLSRDNFEGSEHFFQKWVNIFLSNRELSSEFKYCFDRKQQTPLTGNTLDKPKLILRRTLVKSTQTQNEKITEGTKYSGVQEQVQSYQANYAPMCQAAVPMSANYMMNNDMEMNVTNACVPRMKAYGAPQYRHESYRPSESDIITSYQNFLGVAPLVIPNVPANSEGIISLELPKNYQEIYGSMLIIAVDKGSVAHYLHPLPGHKLVKRDLSLTRALDATKSFSEMRTTTCVNMLDSYFIDDIVSADLQMIDSLEKVMLVMKELMKLYSVTIKDFDKFEKLLKWDTISEEEKNKMVSRYGSHELNLFIYKKDKDYFNKVLKSHLQNKMEKTFIDFYLLGDMPNMLEFYNNPIKFKDMNALEKALLTEAFVKDGKTAFAQAIARSMRNSLLSIKKNIPEQNRIFDVVLSLDSLKTTKPELEGNIQEMKEEYRSGTAEEEAEEGAMDACAEEVGFEEREVGAEDPDDEVQEDQIMPQARGMRMMKTKAVPGAGLFGATMAMNIPAPPPQPKPALEELGETKEYIETNYYDISPAESSRYLITDSEFWADYADYCAKGEGKSFLTHQFVQAYHRLTEAVGAISLLDLPYHSKDHGFKTKEGRSAELKAASNLIIFKKEIRESKEERSPNIVVAQKYIDCESTNDNESAIEEFLVNHIYRGQVVITNISSHKVECDVLLQIPKGALPLASSPYQKSHAQVLDCDVPVKIDYMFYFPTAGSFSHFPPNVSINSMVVAKSGVQTLNVVQERTKICEENFNDVLSTGNYDMILKFIKEKPVEGIKEFSWYNLYWLLKDPKFYEPFVAIMKEQKRFDNTVWSYSLYHKFREDLLIEYLDSVEHFKRSCGYYFDSKLLKVRPIDSKLCHLDYYPLINSRAHKNLSIGTSTNQPMILNEDLYKTYKMWILYLIEKPTWSLADKINLVYYLLLQDRVTEAIKMFSTINVEAEVKKDAMLKMQCDYITAYLDFYTGAPKFNIARKIVVTYINYPIISWRLMFMDMDQQLKEYDGMKVDDEELRIEEEERKEVSKKKLLKSEPLLHVKLEGKEIVIEYDNIPEVAVKYYVIDLEVMFSRTPFLTQSSKEFSFIKPSASETVKLNPKLKEHRMKIPEKYSESNVLIEVNGAVLQQLATYFATSLKLEIFENYGEIKVTDKEGKAQPQVYVKAFMKKSNGSVIFYKDGYTDIRGRFDYVSLNASQLAEAQKFALFVMSKKCGSSIRECLPPPNTIRPEDDLGSVKQRVLNYYSKNTKAY